MNEEEEKDPETAESTATAKPTITIAERKDENLTAGSKPTITIAERKDG